jgi:hypothetical protein
VTEPADPPPATATARPGPQVPLDDASLDRLARWARRMRSGFLVAVVLLLAYGAIVAVTEPTPFIQVLALPFAAPLAIVGLLVQLGERCPRCDARVTLGPRLTLPARCAVCSVALRPDVTARPDGSGP